VLQPHHLLLPALGGGGRGGAGKAQRGVRREPLSRPGSRRALAGALPAPLSPHPPALPPPAAARPRTSGLVFLRITPPTGSSTTSPLMEYMR
jgi:hypothetical protein